MSANRYMVDGGGVTRHIRKRYVIDAGGSTRLIKKRYIIDAGGTARLTFLFGDQLTMVAGRNDSGFIPDAPGYYHQGNSASWEGSLTPVTLGDTSTVSALVSNNNGQSFSNLPGYWFIDIVSVPGYGASNPIPKSYLTEIVVSGPGVGVVSLTGASSVFNTITNNSGSWAWGPGLPAFITGDTYSVSVVRSNA